MDNIITYTTNIASIWWVYIENSGFLLQTLPNPSTSSDLDTFENSLEVLEETRVRLLSSISEKKNQSRRFKGIVAQKINILSLIIHPHHVIPNLISFFHEKQMKKFVNCELWISTFKKEFIKMVIISIVKSSLICNVKYCWKWKIHTHTKIGPYNYHKNCH